MYEKWNGVIPPNLTHGSIIMADPPSIYLHIFIFAVEIAILVFFVTAAMLYVHMKEGER